LAVPTEIPHDEATNVRWSGNALQTRIERGRCFSAPAVNYEDVAASRNDRIDKRIVIHAVKTDDTSFASKWKLHRSSGQSTLCPVVYQQLCAARSVNTNSNIQFPVGRAKLARGKSSYTPGQLNLLRCQETTIAVVRQQKQIATTCTHKNVGTIVAVEVTNLEQVSRFRRRNRFNSGKQRFRVVAILHALVHGRVLRRKCIRIAALDGDDTRPTIAVSGNYVRRAVAIEITRSERPGLSLAGLQRLSRGTAEIRGDLAAILEVKEGPRTTRRVNSDDFLFFRIRDEETGVLRLHLHVQSDRDDCDN